MNAGAIKGQAGRHLPRISGALLYRAPESTVWTGPVKSMPLSRRLKDTALKRGRDVQIAVYDAPLKEKIHPFSSVDEANTPATHLPARRGILNLSACTQGICCPNSPFD
jgi:hypothetical protein